METPIKDYRLTTGKAFGQTWWNWSSTLIVVSYSYSCHGHLFAFRILSLWNAMKFRLFDLLYLCVCQFSYRFVNVQFNKRKKREREKEASYGLEGSVGWIEDSIRKLGGDYADRRDGRSLFLTLLINETAHTTMNWSHSWWFVHFIQSSHSPFTLALGMFHWLHHESRDRVPLCKNRPLSLSVLSIDVSLSLSLNLFHSCFSRSRICLR